MWKELDDAPCYYNFLIPAKFWLCGLVLLLPWHSDHLLLSKNNRYSFICSICWSTEPSWRSPGHHSHCQEKTGDIVTYLCWRARTPGLTQSWCPPRSLEVSARLWLWHGGRFSEARRAQTASAPVAVCRRISCNHDSVFSEPKVRFSLKKID